MENKRLTKKEKTDFICNRVKNQLGALKKEELWGIIYLLKLDTANIKKRATNTELIDYIRKSCKNKKSPYLKIYKEFKLSYFGINISEINNTFNLTNYKRKQLEQYSLLEIAYTYEVKAYGTYLDVPVYTLESFLNLLGEDIDKLLKEERRIARVNKSKKE